VAGACTLKSCDDSHPNPLPSPIAVKGVGGTEKKNYFDDDQVREHLRTAGYPVVYDAVGSREIPELKCTKYDFAFPAGKPAEDRIRYEPNPLNTPYTPSRYVPFSTLLVVATFTSIANALVGQGIAHDAGDGKPQRYTLDIRRYLDRVLDKPPIRWKDLGLDLGNSDKLVWISTTNPVISNSAAQFIALTSYIVNGSKVVGSQGEADQVVGQIYPLFAVQGDLQDSTENLFQAWRTHGRGTYPLAAVYEAQILAAQTGQTGGSNKPLPQDWAVLYPDPPILTDHAVVPYTPKGQAVAEALMKGDLQDDAVRLGFRGQDTDQFVTYFTKLGVPVVKTPKEEDVVPFPDYSWIEYMIKEIDKRRTAGPVQTAPSAGCATTPSQEAK
jgi:hypothetical protein